MHTATVEEAQIRLPQLLDELTHREEIVITREGKPVGRLLPPEPPSGIPVLGRGKGKVLFYDYEDKSHLEDFKEYIDENPP